VTATIYQCNITIIISTIKHELFDILEGRMFFYVRVLCHFILI